MAASGKEEPVRRIDIGDLTENVTAAVQRALQVQAGAPIRGWPGRIIIGIIIDPNVGIQAQQ